MDAFNGSVGHRIRQTEVVLTALDWIAVCELMFVVFVLVFVSSNSTAILAQFSLEHTCSALDVFQLFGVL